MSSHKDYTILEPITALRAHFHVPGRFEGRDVIWDVTLEPLFAYVAQHNGSNTPAAEYQQFIDVHPTAEHIVPVHIVLALPAIRPAEIEKTIIMLRQYKRLQRGPHPYGPHYRITDKHGCIDYTEIQHRSKTIPHPK